MTTDAAYAPELAALNVAIDGAAQWLIRQCRFAGRFEYGYDARGVPMQRYNVARHAGALYALAQFGERPSTIAVDPTIDAASRYLATACIRTVPGQADCFALWGDPEGRPLEAKLGAAGLALAAWCGMDANQVWRPPVKVLSGIGAFIASLQDEHGHFISKYHASKGGMTQWESLYYPGEAALGLTRLYAVDENPDWLDAAERALLYLARKRRASGRCEPDHWALLATEALWPFAMERKALLEHAVMIVETMLAEGQSSGALSRCGRTTPTTTRLEGLLAVRSLLPPGHAVTRSLERMLPAAVAYSLRARVVGGLHEGAVQRAPERSVDAKATELRIDYAQHALSAWMAWRDGATHIEGAGAKRG
ncbi:hypothetical protein [Algiphilus sp.]|uniref:hypothetical protein n=1 Tax=Algiphilus sp. TaxID=1872431 RepID=UPI003B527427